MYNYMSPVAVFLRFSQFSEVLVGSQSLHTEQVSYEIHSQVQFLQELAACMYTSVIEYTHIT